MSATLAAASNRPLAARGTASCGSVRRRGNDRSAEAAHAAVPTARAQAAPGRGSPQGRASTRSVRNPREGATAVSGRSPPPAVTHGGPPELAVGIDVGGTKIAAGLVDREGRVRRRCHTTSHAERPPHEVIAAIERLYAELAERAGGEVAAVGVGFAGNLDAARGEVLVSSNLPAWDHFPLRATLQRRLGVPVALDNDVNMAVVAEHRYGAGRGCRNLCFLTVSTGLGIGIVVDGKVYAGSGSAGELGHVVIELDGAPCTCGKRGCIMAYASGIGISRMVYAAVESGKAPGLRRLLPADGSRVPVQAVAAAARDGDAAAGEILTTAGRYTGVALSIIIQMLDPEVIVIGGGLTRLGNALLEPAWDAMRRHTQAQLLDAVRVLPSRLGADLGMLGAAVQALELAARTDTSEPEETNDA